MADKCDTRPQQFMYAEHEHMLKYTYRCLSSIAVKLLQNDIR